MGNLDQTQSFVFEAEKFKEEDAAVQEKITAKNGLENYCFSMKSSMDEMKEKVEDAEREKVLEAVNKCLAWLDSNGTSAEKVEFEAKQKEIEEVANPVMMKAYQGGAGGAGMPDMGAGMPDMGAAAGTGPEVEEVD